MEMTITLTFEDRRGPESLRAVNAMLQDLPLSALSIDDMDGYTWHSVTRTEGLPETRDAGYGFDALTLKAELATEDVQGHFYQIDVACQEAGEAVIEPRDYIARWKAAHPRRELASYTRVEYGDGSQTHLILHHNGE